jgi:hypothetical protein
VYIIGAFYAYQEGWDQKRLVTFLKRGNTKCIKITREPMHSRVRRSDGWWIGEAGVAGWSIDHGRGASRTCTSEYDPPRSRGNERSVLVKGRLASPIAGRRSSEAKRLLRPH